MKKRYKLLILILGLWSSPYILAGINNIPDLYYIFFHGDINTGDSSKNHSLKRIHVPGLILNQIAYSKIIDSMYVDTIKLTKDGEIDSLHPDPPTYLTYEGRVYADTVNFTYKMETEDGKGFEVDGGNKHLITLNKDGKVIADVINVNPDSAGLLKNCLLLEDVIKPFQNWEDKSGPVYMNHYSKYKFNSECLNPFRGFGSPNGASTCYFWEGTGYFTVVFHKEKLRFKIPVSNQAAFYTGDYDYSDGINYYPVPDRFKSKLNAAFLVYDYRVYMIK
ncbi:hypothetical protein [Pedobacter metabolipauper]|nr:hypothetical protein [Pedobacter metabolipauper]